MSIVWLGVYNVAATVPHFDVTQWVFALTRDQSIKTYSDGISPPPLEQEDLIREGQYVQCLPFGPRKRALGYPAGAESPAAQAGKTMNPNSQ